MGGGSSPLNTGGGMSGGQTQMPNFATPNQLFGFGSGGGGGQQRPNPFSQFGPPANYQQPKLPDWVQAPDPNTPSTNAVVKLTNPATGETFMAPGGGYSVRQQPDSSMVAEEYPTQSFGDMQYRPQQQPGLLTDAESRAQMLREQRVQRGNPAMFGQPQPMQNPFQPQQPSFMQDPEYQGYQTQAQDLSRQMDEYMKKAPMYQQMQDLRNKMAPFQQRYQQQQMQQMQQMQRPSPFRRGQFQQPAGIQGLMGLMGGRGGMQQPRMSMDMPYARGFASELPTYFMKKGGKV